MNNNGKINIILFSYNHNYVKTIFYSFIYRKTIFKIFSKNNLKINYNCELKGTMIISLDDLINLIKAYNNTPIQLCNKHNLKYEYFCENCNLNL